MSAILTSTIFETFPVLKTERLTLREVRTTDAQQIFDMRASGRVNQFIARPAMQGLEDANQLVSRVKDTYEKKLGIAWAGILRDGEQIIGTCGFNNIDAPNLHAEIGGELDTGYWGKNIALEAVSAIVKFGFDTMKLHSIEAKVSPLNRGAIFLLESLGFQKEAHFKDRVYFNGVFSDLAVYTIIS
jgi:ribosomal-protein-alanine N-acetyltransferase